MKSTLRKSGINLSLEIHKMKKNQDAYLKIKESTDEILRELELNKRADITKELWNYLSIGENVRIKKYEDILKEEILTWETLEVDSKSLIVNKREMALLRFVKNKGGYEGKDWMELNRSWRGEMKEVTQARISQIISSLIEKEYLETVQTKGSGSSRVVKIPNNLNIDSLIDSPSNNQRINANSHWSKYDAEKLLSLRRDRTLSVAEIAYEMGRSEASIHSRLATNLHKHSFDAK